MDRPNNPRIPLLTEPDEATAAILGPALARDGEPLNIFSTMAHHPWLLKKFLGLGGQLLNRGVVPARERELVILRVGWNCQSVYEFGQHTIIGLEAGLTQVEIAGLSSGSHDFSEADSLLLTLADELCEHDCVSDDTFKALSETWGNDALIELVLCAGFYRMVSGFLNTFGVPLDEGVPGFPTAD